MSDRKPVLGIVGGIGSGKSAVAAEFVRRGGFLIDADVLGHEALKQADIKQEIVASWGREVLNDQGEINRRALGKIVFADADQRKKLEALVFPWIERRIHEEIGRAQVDAGVQWIVLDAAIMIETGWSRVCDKIVFVDTPLEVRRQRSQRSRGWTEQEFRMREQAQLAVEGKRSQSDAVIDNSGSLDDLSKQVDRLLIEWQW